MKFDKNHSQMIKGIVVLIMIFHHLFTNPKWIIEGVSFFSLSVGKMSVEQYIAGYGKICIAIFAFISGYGLYIKAKEGQLIRKYILVHLGGIMLKWWLVVLLIFLPVSVFCGGDFRIDILCKNLFLVDITWCPFADYLCFYVILMLISPLLFRLVEVVKRPLLIIILSPFASMVARKLVVVCGIEGLLYEIVYFTLLYLPYVLTGICVAQGGLFQKCFLLVPKNSRLGKLAAGVMLLGTIPLRWHICGNRLLLDSFLAMIFVFCCVILLQEAGSSIWGKVWQFFGEHSTNLWFIHAVFFFDFAEYTQRVVYWPYVPLLIWIWCVMLCIPFSSIINKVIFVVKSMLMKLDKPIHD